MRFPGIIPAVTTPFTASGAIDHDALERNLAALLEAGVHGFVATGTMGEAGSLSSEERRTVVEAAVRAADGPVPVIAGVSSGTPAASIAYAADAAAAGADAIMLLPPLGYRADERELIAFFRTVAEGAGLPVIAYNNPEASGVDLPPALIARLAAEVEQVVAIKECSGDARRIPALLDAHRPRGAGRRRRLGARGLLRGRDGLDHRRRRLRAGRVRRALRGVPRPPTSSGRARSTPGCSRSRGST